MRLSGIGGCGGHKGLLDTPSTPEGLADGSADSPQLHCGRAYSDHLFDLMDQLKLDPLDEDMSFALVEHVVNNRSTAAELFAALQTQALGVSC